MRKCGCKVCRLDKRENAEYREMIAYWDAMMDHFDKRPRKLIHLAIRRS